LHIRILGPSRFFCDINSLRILHGRLHNAATLTIYTDFSYIQEDRMLWMRINALAAATLLSLLSTEAVQAQMQNPSMNAQAMMMHHQMMNQMDMMRRSQQLQLMARAREAQGHCRGAVQGATGKHCRAAPRKPK
jgi:hypothetical protein